MIEPKRRREIKALVHKIVTGEIIKQVENDEEFLFALLWAQNYISSDILSFQDNLTEE